jgi:hypothetical protein
MKLPWSKVVPGMRVELKGRVWLVLGVRVVTKKRAQVILSAEGLPDFSGEVKLKDEVAIARPTKAEPKPKATPLRDERNAQQRWATEAEAKAAEPARFNVIAQSEGRDGFSATLEPGDPEQVKPPKKAKGDPWETQADRIETMLGDVLGARLVGESLDTGAGYYVPPTDVSTIKAHLLIFHPGTDLTATEGDLLEWHGIQHTDARAGIITLAINHWHTERRPS